MFHVPCPSCGGTTSFAHYVRGQWPSSARANPAAFVFAILVTGAIPWLLATAALGRQILIQDPFRLLAVLACIVVLIALLQWLGRVLPQTALFLR
jgi:hypothetical protein